MTMIWLPEAIVLAGALASLAFGVLGRRSSPRAAMDLALVFTLAALLATAALAGTVVEAFAGAFRIDGVTLSFQLLLLVGTALTLLLAREDVGAPAPATGGAAPSGGVPAEHAGEYAGLLLLAALGGMLIAAAADLLLLFLGLELLSIAGYALVGFRKEDPLSTQAAVKYVLTGATATGVFVFGLSYLIGLTGTTDVYAAGEVIASPGFMERYGRLIFLAFLFLFIGAAYKIAAFPFHLWAPDVYRGAPTPVTMFLAVVSKAAGLALIVRLYLGAFAWTHWVGASGLRESFLLKSGPVVALVSGFSMVLGSVLALRTRDVKRLFAYAGIAHAGYLLVPLAAANPAMLDQIVFYLLAYLLASAGAFAVLRRVTEESGTSDLKAFAGLYHRAPWSAWALLLFFLSLAGIPLTMGFFGKWYLLVGAAWGGHGLLATLIVVTSVMSYAYYFAVLKQAFLRPGPTERPIRFRGAEVAVVLIAAAGVLLGGLLPGEVLRTIAQAFDAAHFFGLYDGRL
ncbi:MAG: NADH-ubiquinone oxidoreductase chain N [Hydrogenibacillus schlegelii]|uniref:NADH-quinone oxidoreductase subunit N n=1 Tax=Hydrogenibacillus schlegelii TaxID=1484 RepID=A0A2T5GEG3_HYDSH|nr:NADH-quinone oxidoreductase subunit N [Hydrogenibacillus schlegelii]PTQ54578.1 MAG: NADH-ubiquinone oxidoreductase chain N [Hydrogenibacillus schlegelii]